MTDFDPQSGRDAPADVELTVAELDADERDVGEAVQGLAGLVSQAEDLDTVLTQIAEFALVATPHADGAGVTLISAGGGERSPRVMAWAVTAPFVREIDHLQYEICEEGPCLTAMQTRRPLTSGSLGSDDRWRRFGGRVARLRVHSALAVPLVLRGEVVGALNIYAHDRDAFTEHAVRLSERFSGPAAVAVNNIRLLHEARARADQLQTALTSRAVIDQAIGIVRSRSGGSADEAFERLKQISQAENVKLSVVATRLVDEAVRRAHARHGTAEQRGS